MTSADVDRTVTAEYLDTAQLHAAARNQWAEGYWVGRAVEYAQSAASERPDEPSDPDSRGS